jgi:hypothetical protein
VGGIAVRSAVEGAANAAGASIQDVGVDHRGADLLVAKQLLDRADIIASFQKVGREGVTEGVGRDVLWNSGSNSGAPDLPLDDRLVKVVATDFTGGGVDIGAARREYPLPGPLPGRRGVLAAQRLG